MVKISKHISYKEATKSRTATINGIDNHPDQEQLERMKNVAEKVFEPLREHFGVPIVINSFFRSEELNRRIGGATRSSHMTGEAIDIDDTMGGVTNSEMFHWIKDNLVFEKMIWEYGNDESPNWIHVSLSMDGENKNQLLRARRDEGKTHYDQWLG